MIAYLNGQPTTITEIQIPDAVSEVAKAIAALPPGGCCLHIVTEDNNLKTGHVQWCLDYARANEHEACIAVAEALLPLTITRRTKAIRLAEKGAA